MEKGFSERKGQQSKLAFTIHRTLFPAGTTYCVYICGAEWKTWCYFERAEKSLSVMSGRAVKRDVMNVNQMMRILSRFRLCLFPPSFRKSSRHTPGWGWWWWWRGRQNSAAAYGKHYSQIQHQSECKILPPVLCNHIKSCRHARSVAWTGLDREPQHQYVSSSLHYASLLLLFLILNIRLLDIIILIHFTAYVIKQHMLIYSYYSSMLTLSYMFIFNTHRFICAQKSFTNVYCNYFNLRTKKV